MSILLDITWGAPGNLVYAPLFIGAFWLVVYRVRRSRLAARQLAGAGWMRLLLHNFSPVKNIIKGLLLITTFIFLFLALLRPQWHKKDENVLQEGRDLFIALDVSRSMLARDCIPNRLSFAKKKIKTLVRRLKCERVGLILFSGSAFVQCPLTADHAAFFMFLDQVDVETISSGTTALDQAINQTLKAFDSSGERKNKLLVLFTDGEDFSSNLLRIKRQATEQGLHIFAMGVGSPEGAPIPLFDMEGNQTGHQLDKKGSVVISRLNEGILHSLAVDSDGLYLRLTDDDADVQALLAHVERYEREQFENRRFAKLEEQYPYFVAVSFICYALEWLL